MVDLSKLNFFSGVNYMKRSDRSGQSTRSLAGAGEVVVVDHDLDYIPHYDAYMDVLGDGTIWYGGTIVDEYTETSLSGYDWPTLDLRTYVSTTQLTLRIEDITVSPGITGDRELYWLIYLDYGA